MFDVITIGSATYDVFLVEKDFQLIKSKSFSTGVGECFAYGAKIDIDQIYFDTGGGATNSAVTFRHLGLKPAVLTRIGHDLAGQEIIQVLEQEKITSKFVIFDQKERTAYSTVLLSRNRGERTILIYRGASSNFSPKDFPWASLKTGWFFITTLAGQTKLIRKIIDFAQKNKIKVAINPGVKELNQGPKSLKPSLSKIDILLLNRKEAALLAQKPSQKIKEIFLKLQEICPGIVVVTDATQGAYVAYGKDFFYAPSTGNPALNATGAGDAFGSAFTVGMILKNDVTYALRLGILNSGRVVAKMGAKKGLLGSLPSLKRLSQLKVIKSSL